MSLSKLFLKMFFSFGIFCIISYTDGRIHGVIINQCFPIPCASTSYRQFTLVDIFVISSLLIMPLSTSSLQLTHIFLPYIFHNQKLYTFQHCTSRHRTGEPATSAWQGKIRTCYLFRTLQFMAVIVILHNLALNVYRPQMKAAGLPHGQSLQWYRNSSRRYVSL